jgi:hypothetical protein
VPGVFQLEVGYVSLLFEDGIFNFSSATGEPISYGFVYVTNSCDATPYVAAQTVVASSFFLTGFNPQDRGIDQSSGKAYAGTGDAIPTPSDVYALDDPLDLATCTRITDPNWYTLYSLFEVTEVPAPPNLVPPLTYRTN